LNPNNHLEIKLHRYDLKVYVQAPLHLKESKPFLKNIFPFLEMSKTFSGFARRTVHQE